MSVLLQLTGMLIQPTTMFIQPTLLMNSPGQPTPTPMQPPDNITGLIQPTPAGMTGQSTSMLMSQVFPSRI